MRFCHIAADSSRWRLEQVNEIPLTGAPIVGVWPLDTRGTGVSVLGPLPPAPW